MRQRILYDSVRPHLSDGERIRDLVHMWRRHHLLIPYAGAAFVGLFVLAFVVGITAWSGRVGLALAGASLAAMATTEYRVLARTTEGLVLLRSSRVRQRATELIKRLPDTTVITPVSSNLVLTEWKVNKATYSVMKRYQGAMVTISQR